MTTKFFLTLMSHASVCFLYAHSLDCSSNGIDNAMVKCLNGTGLEEGGVGLTAIMMSDPRDLCRNISISQKATHCLAHLARECSAKDIRAFTVDPAIVNRTVQLLCDNIAAIDVLCQQSASPDLIYCYFENKHKPFISEVDERCYFFQANSECVAEVFPRCGCNTTNIYLQMFKQMNPSICKPYKVRIPGCKLWPDAKKFSGSGNFHRMSLLLWVALVLYSFCAAK